MENAKPVDATYRVILFRTRTKGHRYVAMAWNYDEAVIFTTGDHPTYTEAREELTRMAEMLGEMGQPIRLRWFDGEYEHRGAGNELYPRDPSECEAVNA